MPVVHSSRRKYIGLRLAYLRVRRWLTWPIDHIRASRDRPRWLKTPPPLSARKVCILACHAKDGRLGAHPIALSRAWTEAGFDLVLVVATDGIAPRADDPAFAQVAGLLVRGNHGYDFGSWAAALRLLPQFASFEVLALANDSVFGPLDGFDDVLSRAEASTAGIVALTDSVEFRPHLQSYLIFYKRAALTHPAFARFWLKTWSGRRDDVVRDGELSLLSAMRRAGIAIEVLFPASPDKPFNRTLITWRELIDAGFPFIKIQLLRDNPYRVDLAGWAGVLARRGYDPARVAAHFGPTFKTTAAGRSDATTAGS